MQKLLQTVEIDVPGGDRAPLYKCVSERIVILLAPPQHDVTICLKEVGESIRESHSRGFIHGNVSSFKISRMMERGYEVSNVASASNTQLGDYIGASSSLVSTGGISPTMVASLDFEGYVKYQKYWKTVHDDALTQLIVNQLDVSRLTDIVQRCLAIFLIDSAVTANCGKMMLELIYTYVIWLIFVSQLTDITRSFRLST